MPRRHSPTSMCASDLLFKIGKIDKLIRLPAQFVGDHGGLRLKGRHNADALALLLERCDEATEISVA